MAQFEPSRILDNFQSDVDKENLQQYVEIAQNTFLGTRDGIKYTLLPTPDNKFKLCEIPIDTNSDVSDLSNSWSESFEDDSKCDNFLTPPSASKTLKFITVKSESTPCRGQGDESGNSILSIPDSTSLLKNSDNSIPGKNLDLFESDVIQLGKSPQLTYTPLLSKQEQRIESLENSEYAIPSSYFQFPQPLRPSLSVNSEKYPKSRHRIQLVSPPGIPYPQLSPIPYQRGRGQRQRRPRQVYYQYRTPVLHSTPTSTTSTSLSDNLPLSTIDPVTSSSIISSSESQSSLEFPRVPNNTPNSSMETIEDKDKILNLEWVPQIQARIANYREMDPRESHNEKERKRRLRIKNACLFMKNLLPRVCNKTDNATVLENAVHFIAFMQDTIGDSCDMEFMEQTCMY